MLIIMIMIREGFLLEKEQLDKIKHIPTFIVQGRYDIVCPPISGIILYCYYLLIYDCYYLLYLCSFNDM